MFKYIFLAFYLLENIEDLNPEYSKLVDDHFWELI